MLHDLCRLDYFGNIRRRGLDKNNDVRAGKSVVLSKGLERRRSVFPRSVASIASGTSVAYLYTSCHLNSLASNRKTTHFLQAPRFKLESWNCSSRIHPSWEVSSLPPGPSRCRNITTFRQKIRPNSTLSLLTPTHREVPKSYITMRRVCSDLGERLSLLYPSFPWA
jgi:hypothetical protein